MDKGEAPFCECGYCNERVKWNKWKKCWNRFIYGHNSRGKNNSHYGKDKYKAEREKPAPLCGCGCGGHVKWNKNKKTYNRFITSHNVRGNNYRVKPPDSEAPLCRCVNKCGERVGWNRKTNDWNEYVKEHYNPMHGQDKYKKEREKEPPICECGLCGEKTKWSTCRRQYNRFIKGHQSRGKNNANFNKKHAEEKAKEAPLCACGCGKHVKWSERYKRWNKLIRGHNLKGKKHPLYGKITGKKHPSYGKTRPDASDYMLNGGAAHANSFVRNPSKPQMELYNLVKQTSMYSHAILNYPALNRSIDIAIPSQMIAIEYDGSYWHKDREEADKARQKELEANGWAILRYCDYVPSIKELEKDLQQTGRNC